MMRVFETNRIVELGVLLELGALVAILHDHHRTRLSFCAMSSTGILVGLNKGFPTEKRPNIRKTRPGQRKGSSVRRTKVVREIIREVAGLKPYEKRILDMIKTGGGAADKKIYKFAKARVSYSLPANMHATARSLLASPRAAPRHAPGAKEHTRAPVDAHKRAARCCTVDVNRFQCVHLLPLMQIRPARATSLPLLCD